MMTRAADAFVETLHELGLDEAELDGERFGRRAALLAASELLWERELGPLVGSQRVSELLRASRQAINERVHRGSLLALPAPNGGYVFPLFQFTSDGQPAPGLNRVIRALRDAVATTYTIAEWLVTPEPELDRRAPIELLREGEVERVETTAERYADRLRQ